MKLNFLFKRSNLFVRGDIDGFIGLSLDNLIQILLIISLCRGVLGYPDSLIFGKILPATGISLLVGNLLYARQAFKLARREKRDDRTALPYGINTVSLFAYIFLVMLPVKISCLSQGLSEQEAILFSWQAGIMACFGSGIIETLGAYCAGILRKWLPRAALLSTLAGIAIGYIALGFLLRTYSEPIVGLTVLAIVLITYYGKLKIPIPGGLLALIVGILLAWNTGLINLDSNGLNNEISQVGLRLPELELRNLWQARDQIFPWLGIIIPMGLFNVLGSLQNIESAEAAGDRYPVRESLLINGIGTIGASVFGSCFPTTIYIGHPAWKEMGARIAYSWINGLVMFLACILGLFGIISRVVPIESGMAIVLYIGLVMAAQAFQATPKKHAPAVVFGLLPGLAGWGTLLLKTGLRIGSQGNNNPFNMQIISELNQADIWANGAFALEQGLIITAMLLAGIVVYVIEQKFLKASFLAIAASFLSWIGIIHSWKFTLSDVSFDIGWGTGSSWAFGYFLMAIVFLVANKLQK